MATIVVPESKDQRFIRKRITLACNGCRAKRTRKRLALSTDLPETSPVEGELLRARDEGITITSRVELVPAPADNSEEDSSMEELADALGCFTLGDYGELRFFGASSNFSIIQNHSLRVSSSMNARNRGIAAVRQIPNPCEPSHELRDHLLSLFWRWQNSWQYIVPRDSFILDLYVEKTGRYCTPLLLSAIYALASRYSPRPELRTNPDDPNTAGEMFIAPAQAMLHCEYEAPTTSTVQAAALLGLYWAAVDRESLGFMYIGMASRMAMNLGLHSDCSKYVSRGIVSEEDGEARNVAFWGIYVLDKLYCLGMGRPAGIQEYNITAKKPKSLDRSLPALTKEQNLISQPFPSSHITDNAMHMCEILIITSEVIDQLYAQRQTWTDRERDERIMQTHLRLVKFFDHLPKNLKISESSLQPAPPYVYQLHLQYHVSIILLHRPFFRILYRGRKTGDYDPEGKEVHSQSCKVSAGKISTILRIYKKNFKNRHMPISAVHPAFTAAIIHLLDVKTALPHAQSGAMKRLGICIKTLYEMNENWDWANRSIRAIQSLATQWKVDIWASGLANDISKEHQQQFERYSKECRSTSLIAEEGTAAQSTGVEMLDEAFNIWSYEQSALDVAFNFPDYD
ncbi:hypothetical protein K505DRAFT_245348 [Melanomma pulvis-pyrius CBS 109.77]|uniref:Xylanolytic transcriptional activator regulatory domain-containing protein n=1 Tax=Melanomma pulvis-pyrius CBS 109.77 TaxID=1314802 RepID=A0A6A6X9J4_9PLEO|nr:hypothetical protein K505DRAFT_245348 [Melanomma pulvis-pyrius CBS 109.77]